LTHAAAAAAAPVAAAVAAAVAVGVVLSPAAGCVGWAGVWPLGRENSRGGEGDGRGEGRGFMVQLCVCISCQLHEQ